MLSALLACGREDAGRETDAASDTVASRDTAGVAVERLVCSAAGVDPSPARLERLPSAVAAMRDSILEAAIACDYGRLEALALAGGPIFVYSFGVVGRPADHWRELEAGGEEPMAMLVRTLSLPWARETLEVEPHVYYVWPSAYLIEATPADWRALERLYTAEELEAMREYGGFIGWRAGITETGDWRFFVAGD